VARWGKVNQWNTSVWGKPNAVPSSGFTPYVIVVRFNDDSVPTLELYSSDIIDLAFEFEYVLDSGQDESISASFWTSNSGLLIPQVPTNTKTRSISRLANSMKSGDSAAITCKATTSLGKILTPRAVISSRLP
jgi:hypothetical protein